MHNRFEEADGYIKNYDGSKYQGLYPRDEKYERVFERIKCVISQESNTSHEWALENDRIDDSEGIDIHKTEGSRKCIICHNYYLLRINFRFQPKLCDGCLEKIQKSWDLIMLWFLLL